MRLGYAWVMDEADRLAHQEAFDKPGPKNIASLYPTTRPRHIAAAAKDLLEL